VLWGRIQVNSDNTWAAKAEMLFQISLIMALVFFLKAALLQEGNAKAKGVPLFLVLL
jgi:hypothetical protein